MKVTSMEVRASAESTVSRTEGRLDLRLTIVGEPHSISELRGRLNIPGAELTPESLANALGGSSSELSVERRLAELERWRDRVCEHAEG